MLRSLPKIQIFLTAFWIVILSALSLGLYHKQQFVSGCYARLGQLELLETQAARNEAQIAAAEAMRNNNMKP